MATTTVSDFVIWTKHIHGDAALVARLVELAAGDVLNLQVNGVEGAWRKMDDGKDGRPTPGLRPIGNAQNFWRTLYRTRRGQTVEIEIASPRTSGVSEDARAFLTAEVVVRSETERSAALDAFLSLARQGWRSDTPYGS